MDQILFYPRRSSVRKLLQEKINPERWSFFSKWSFFSETKEWKKIMKDLTHESEEWRHLVTTGAVEACKIFKISCVAGVLLALYLYFGKGGGGGGGGDVVVNDEDVVVNDEDVNDDNVDDGNVAGGGGFRGGSQVNGSLIRHWEYLEAKKRKSVVSAGLPSIYAKKRKSVVPRKKMVGGHLDIAIFELIMSTKIELTKLNQVANLFEWLIRLKTPPHVLVSNLCRVGTVSREKVLFNPMSSPFNAYNPMKHGPPNQLEKNVLVPVSVALDAILARKGERKPDLFAVMAYHCLLRS